MLSRVHRITRGEDFRHILRRGSKHSTTLGLVAVAPGREAVVRFGFIVPKKVGGAVVRNRLKRQLRAVCQSWTHLPPTDVVIRVEPAARELDFVEIKSELDRVLGSVDSAS